jgi:ECF sigma factor
LLGERETAEALDISERSVQRDWATERAWLQRQIEQSL